MGEPARRRGVGRGTGPRLLVSEALAGSSKPQQVLVRADTGKVILSWAANAEEDLLGYYVYKSLDDGNNADNQFLVINTDPINENQYIEELPRNVKNKFVYALVAVDQSLNRSEMSELSVARPLHRHALADRSDRCGAESNRGPEDSPE